MLERAPLAIHLVHQRVDGFLKGLVARWYVLVLKNETVILRGEFCALACSAVLGLSEAPVYRGSENAQDEN